MNEETVDQELLCLASGQGKTCRAVHRRESKYGVAIGTVLPRVRGRLVLSRGGWLGVETQRALLCLSLFHDVSCSGPKQQRLEQTLMLMPCI